jgi:hypothetical protein
MNAEQIIDLFSTDYKNIFSLGAEEAARQFDETINLCKNVIEEHPFFQSLEEEKRERFIHLANICHLLAYQTQAELSISLHPAQKQASVIILEKYLHFYHEFSAILSALLSSATSVSIEAVEENGPKTVFFILFSFDEKNI